MTSTKRLVSLAENRTEHQQKVLGKQTITRDEVAELITTLYGPMAKVLREVCARQMALEDGLGFKWVPAVQDIRGADVEPGHFVRCEPGVRTPTCVRCGKALTTDAEKLTMLCAEYCGEPETTAGPGYEEPGNRDVILSQLDTQAREAVAAITPGYGYASPGEQGEGREGGDRE